MADLYVCPEHSETNPCGGCRAEIAEPQSTTEAPDRIYLPADTSADTWNILAKNPSRDWSTGESANNIEYARVSAPTVAPEVDEEALHRVICGSPEVQVSPDNVPATLEVRTVLNDSYRALSSLPKDCLGRDPTGYYYRDELIMNIGKVLFSGAFDEPKKAEDNNDSV